MGWRFAAVANCYSALDLYALLDNSFVIERATGRDIMLELNYLEVLETSRFIKLIENYKFILPSKSSKETSNLFIAIYDLCL